RLLLSCVVLFCFFFQAEDGIRDFHVTGVQTCALPISVSAPTQTVSPSLGRELARDLGVSHASAVVVGTIIGSGIFLVPAEMMQRSEERRVGKEGRVGMWSSC